MAIAIPQSRYAKQLPPKGHKISLDQVPPKVRRWLASKDRSASPQLTSYVPGYFDTNG